MWGRGGLVIFVNVRVKPLPHNAFMPRILHSIHTQTFLTFCTLARHCVFAFRAVYSAFSLQDQRSVGLEEQQNIPPTRLGSVILTIFVLCAARHTFSQGEKRH